MVTIDKVDFERALPVGASSHEEVYLSVQGAIGEQLVCSTESLLGEAGEKMVDAAENDSPLVLFFKKYVCLSGNRLVQKNDAPPRCRRACGYIQTVSEQFELQSESS
jgi:hypothetical protein